MGVSKSVFFLFFKFDVCFVKVIEYNFWKRVWKLILFGFMNYVFLVYVVIFFKLIIFNLYILVFIFFGFGLLICMYFEFEIILNFLKLMVVWFNICIYLIMGCWNVEE